jgi:hypothetical protein
MAIQCIIDGSQLSLGGFAVASMNFGQERLWVDRPTGRYSLHIPHADICRELFEYHAENHADALQYPEIEGPIARTLWSLGWPSLEQLLVDAPDTYRDIVSAYSYHLLLAVEPQHRFSRWEFLLVSVDGVFCHDEFVEFTGIALRNEQPQDKSYEAR